MSTFDDLMYEIAIYDEKIELAEARKAELRSSINRNKAELPFIKNSGFADYPLILEWMILSSGLKTLDLHIQWLHLKQNELKQEVAEIRDNGKELTKE